MVQRAKKLKEDCVVIDNQFKEMLRRHAKGNNEAIQLT